MQCGLLGRTLGHSYSPQIHNMLGDYKYRLYEVEPDQLGNFLNSGDYNGLNVTIPYKKAVIPYCDSLSDCAMQLGAVNTLVRRNGKLIGHNTDYFGFLSMVQKSGVTVANKKALVLGSGGASATAVAVLKGLGANVTVISRNGPDHYGNIGRHTDASMIVNATPVGMYPDTCQSPLDLSDFQKLECVLDLIYNPANTKLLQQAQHLGIPCQNGLWMLVAQAKESAEWFMERKIPDAVIQQIYDKIRMQMENIILIGMPGCGKTTIGKLLADQLNRNFIDADQALESYYQTTIPAIFDTQGESGFRKMETAILADICKKSGAVIATGGGCVTQSINYGHLRQNGRIIWIKRPLDLLPTDGRPLSQSNKLTDLYSARQPLYRSFCDFEVENDGDPAKTVSEILQKLNGGIK